MVIKHVSILNLDKAGINKNSSISNYYSMRVYLSNSPDQTWKSHFTVLWRRMFFYKRKRLELSHNEIRVYLERSDDLQKHIESLKKLVDRTNSLVILEQKRRKTEQKRKLKICSMIRVKTYKIV